MVLAVLGFNLMVLAVLGFNLMVLAVLGFNLMVLAVIEVICLDPMVLGNKNSESHFICSFVKRNLLGPTIKEGSQYQFLLSKLNYLNLRLNV